MRRTREFLEILAHLRGQKKCEIALFYDPLSPEEEQKVESYMKRLELGEPLAYILGEVEFFGCTLEVTRDGLIPRLESELLVELALKEISEKGVLLDLCCGGGALGLVIKKERPFLEVILSDLSEKAAALAKKNAKRNGLDVEILVGDLFGSLEGRKIDFLICNPPYITESEYEVLEASVRDFEPKLALVGGEDGLFFYRRIANELPLHLKKGGKVFFEIGSLQGESIKNLFKEGPWKGCRVLKDFAGHDRFFFLEKQT